MISVAIAALVLCQTPITIPTFASWDGKSWAGVAVGTPEKDLRKQVKTSKTVTADPASIRLASDQWVVTAILTQANQKGGVAGFAVEAERDEPVASLESLQQELGPPDFTAYPRLRYTDWSLDVWKDRGIAAVVRGRSHPLAYKVLLVPSEELVKNLDLWDRDPNRVSEFPRVPISNFEVSISVDPRDNSLSSATLNAVRLEAAHAMDSYRGPGWYPVRSDGARAQVGITVKKKTDYAIDVSLSVSHRDEFGSIDVSGSGSATVKRDIEVADRTRRIFEDLVARLPRDIEEKFRRLVWQAEWRPFYALARPRG